MWIDEIKVCNRVGVASCVEHEAVGTVEDWRKLEPEKIRRFVDRWTKGLGAERGSVVQQATDRFDGSEHDKVQDNKQWGGQEAGKPDRTLRLFLASSAELLEERNEFELYFREKNDDYRKQGVYLEINRWENFLDAMSETSLQDEYNKKVRNCDIFVSLFFTKAGKFTEKEFDVAYGQFKDSRKPRIYTFFKNANLKTGSMSKEDFKSLWAFQEKLTAVGHFYTSYDDIEHLKRQFRDQLDKLLPELTDPYNRR